MNWIVFWCITGIVLYFFSLVSKDVYGIVRTFIGMGKISAVIYLILVTSALFFFGFWLIVYLIFLLIKQKESPVANSVGKAALKTIPLNICLISIGLILSAEKMNVSPNEANDGNKLWMGTIVFISVVLVPVITTVDKARKIYKVDKTKMVGNELWKKIDTDYNKSDAIVITKKSIFKAISDPNRVVYDLCDTDFRSYYAITSYSYDIDNIVIVLLDKINNNITYAMPGSPEHFIAYLEAPSWIDVVEKAETSDFQLSSYYRTTPLNKRKKDLLEKVLKKREEVWVKRLEMEKVSRV